MADQITLTQFAKKIGNLIASRTLQDWKQKGIIPPPEKGSRGRHDAWGLVEATIRYYQTQVTEDEDQLRFAKIRSENARARKLELDVAETEGDLVRAADVAGVWGQAFSLIQKKLLSLEVSLTDELDGITDKLIRREIIGNALRENLEELGGGGLASLSNGTSDAVSASPETTPKTEGE